jgi:hypothetical protein
MGNIACSYYYGHDYEITHKTKIFEETQEHPFALGTTTIQYQYEQHCCKKCGAIYCYRATGNLSNMIKLENDIQKEYYKGIPSIILTELLEKYRSARLTSSHLN